VQEVRPPASDLPSPSGGIFASRFLIHLYTYVSRHQNLRCNDSSQEYMVETFAIMSRLAQYSSGRGVDQRRDNRMDAMAQSLKPLWHHTVDVQAASRPRPSSASTPAVTPPN